MPAGILAAIELIAALTPIIQHADSAVADIIALIKKAQAEDRDISDEELAGLQASSHAATDELLAALGVGRPT